MRFLKEKLDKMDTIELEYDDIEVSDGYRTREVNWTYDAVIDSVIDFLIDKVPDDVPLETEEEIDDYFEDHLDEMVETYYDELKEHFRDYAEEDARDYDWQTRWEDDAYWGSTNESLETVEREEPIIDEDELYVDDAEIDFADDGDVFSDDVSDEELAEVELLSNNVIKEQTKTLVNVESRGDTQVNVESDGKTSVNVSVDVDEEEPIMDYINDNFSTQPPKLTSVEGVENENM